MKKITEAIVTKKPFSYQGQIVVISDWKIVDGLNILTLKAEGKTGVFTAEMNNTEVEIFIDAPLPLQLVKSSGIHLVKPMENLFSKLAKGLEDDFDKIESSPEYIPQTKQRVDTVKTMIEMAKVQAAILKDRE